MTQEHGTAAVRLYLDPRAGDEPADPIPRQLLDRTVNRLEMLFASTPYSSYPRLTRPLLNLDKDEVLCP